LLCFLAGFSSPVISSHENNSNFFDAYDLGYREVLYYLFQQQYQTALTNLEIIKQENPTGKLDREAEIVAGELNLGYGLLEKAEDIFQHLLEKQDTPEIPDKIWLELSSIYYAQNSMEKSARAFSHIQNTLTATQRADYELLKINLLIDQDQIPAGRKKFDQSNPDNWYYYSQYNLGTGLIRNNHISEGTRILDELGTITTNNDLLSDEIKSLGDKTNTTLGYYYLDAHNAKKSISYFERVRLNSPYTNKALLGMGWAYAELGNLKYALAPWMKLQNGDLSDIAVQDSLLTVPYALNELKAQRQALDQFNNAIDRYKNEIQFLQSKIETIQNKGWLTSRVNMTPDAQVITNQDIRNELLENPYLDPLATDSPFLKTINHYNELNILKHTLINAQRDINAYRSYVVNRRHLILDQAPDTLHDNYVNSIESGKYLDRLKLELARIAQTEDALALMTEEEQHQLIVLKLVNDNITDLSKLFNLGRLDDKLRIYRGIILWDITMEYDARLKKAQQDLATLEKDITGLSQQRGNIKNLGQGNVDELDKFEYQLASQEAEVESILEMVETGISLQESRLTDSVIAVLKKQQSHLKANMGQAYTSIAQLYELAYMTGQKENK